MFGVLTDAETEDILHRQTIGRIGCHTNGKTYVVPISYVYDGKFIYCHSHEGMKIKMMRENPEVCFETDNLENAQSWKSVIAWGKFEELINKQDRHDGLKALMNGGLISRRSKTIKIDLGDSYPFPPDDLNHIPGIIFRINMYEKSGRFEIAEQGSNYVNG